MIYGVQKGWGSVVGQVGDEIYDLKLIPDGVYTVKVSVEKKYRDALGLSNDVATIKVTVKTMKEPGHPEGRLGKGKKGVAPKPAAKEPTGEGAVPQAGPKPDLRALPSFGIFAEGDDPETPEKESDTLAFGANVWNAGPSPLVVDGFRRPSEDIMDAYQYFYDANGKQIGYEQTGTMEWDPREATTTGTSPTSLSTACSTPPRPRSYAATRRRSAWPRPTRSTCTVKGANWQPGDPTCTPRAGNDGARRPRGARRRLR